MTSKPNPIPLLLVVTNGSNIRLATAGSTPAPLSLTLTPTHPAFSGATLIVTARRSDLASAIASKAFMSRFSTHCCSSMLSPMTRGTEGETSTCTEVFRIAASPAVSFTTSLTKAPMSIAVLCSTWFLNMERMRRTISAVRLVSSIALLTASTAIAGSGFP